MECDSQEDLIALRHYLTSIFHPLEDTQFELNCSSYEALTLLRDILLSGKFRPATRQASRGSSVSVYYTIAERGNEEMLLLEETFKEMNAELRDELKLTLSIDEWSAFDGQRAPGHLPHVSHHLKTVWGNGASPDVVISLANAMSGLKSKMDMFLTTVNIHGQLRKLAPLVPPSLSDLGFHACGLDDDDIPDMISILPAGHGLRWLDVPFNAFRLNGVEILTAHLRGLPHYPFEY